MGVNKKGGRLKFGARELRAAVEKDTCPKKYKGRDETRVCRRSEQEVPLLRIVVPAWKASGTLMSSLPLECKEKLGGSQETVIAKNTTRENGTSAEASRPGQADMEAGRQKSLPNDAHVYAMFVPRDLHAPTARIPGDEDQNLDTADMSGYKALEGRTKLIAVEAKKGTMLNGDTQSVGALDPHLPQPLQAMGMDCVANFWAVQSGTWKRLEITLNANTAGLDVEVIGLFLRLPANSLPMLRQLDPGIRHYGPDDFETWLIYTPTVRSKIGCDFGQSTTLDICLIISSGMAYEMLRSCSCVERCSLRVGIRTAACPHLADDDDNDYEEDQDPLLKADDEAEDEANDEEPEKAGGDVALHFQTRIALRPSGISLFGECGNGDRWSCEKGGSFELGFKGIRPRVWSGGSDDSDYRYEGDHEGDEEIGTDEEMDTDDAMYSDDAMFTDKVTDAVFCGWQ
ncbi:hypothetical protein DFH09DRAFT_1280153 [Mycena vulgaris]|nr:hypothetical protein DFH09DRAFT_1280153 [Mycena vulgaris]